MTRDEHLKRLDELFPSNPLTDTEKVIIREAIEGAWTQFYEAQKAKGSEIKVDTDIYDNISLTFYCGIAYAMYAIMVIEKQRGGGVSNAEYKGIVIAATQLATEAELSQIVRKASGTGLTTQTDPDHKDDE